MAKASESPVGEICLYGAQHCGFGWLARMQDGRMFGDGELNPQLSATGAYWQAAGALQKAGYAAGKVQLFAPGGMRMAEFQLESARWPYFGDLKWQAAPVYEIPYEAFMAAAEQAGNGQ